MRFGPYALAAFSLAGFGGCSLLVDTSDLASGSSREDAGRDGAASTSEAGLDAAAPDAGRDADAAVLPFCASHADATFCEDFSGVAFDEKMSPTLDSTGGTAALSLDHGSLLVKVTGQKQTGQLPEPSAYLSKHLTASIGGFTCEIAILARALDGDFTIVRAQAPDGFIISIDATTFASYFGGPTDRTPLGTLTATPPVWRRFRFGVENQAQASGANAGKRRVWLEQTEPSPRSIAELFVSYPTAATSLDLAIGVGGYEPTNADLNLDDFACTIVPR